MTTEKPRTIVEFVDDKKHDVAHGAQKIRINGTEVLVEAGSIDLTFGDKQITKLTLTLLPTEVHFIHDAPAPPEGTATDFLFHGEKVKVLKGHTNWNILGKVGSVIESKGDGFYEVFVDGTNHRIPRQQLERATDDRPLQVGDTVSVPKGAAYFLEDGSEHISFIAGPCEATVQNLKSRAGNLVLKKPGHGALYNVHPDQVTRVQR